MGSRHTALSFTFFGLGVLSYMSAIALGGGILADVLSPLLSLLILFFLACAGFRSLRYRFSWFSLALAAGFWAIAESLWVFLEHRGLDPKQSVPLMVLYTVPNAAFLSSILYIAFYDRQRWTSFQFLLDTACLFASALAFMYFAVFSEKIGGLFFDRPETVSYFVNLLFDILIVTFSVTVTLSMDLRKMPAFLACTALGTLLYSLADIAYTYAAFHGTYIPNAFEDVLYNSSFALTGAGALLYLGNPLDDVAIRKKTNTARNMVYRGLLLTMVPLLATVIRPLGFHDFLTFALIILIHQLVSLIIRRLIERESQLGESKLQSEYLEATIAGRTRELLVMNETLQNLIDRDAITGQFNRKYFLEKAEEWIAARKERCRLWMVIVDFNRFKSINDTYGHDTGDRVLRQVSRRFESLTDERTLFARLGGDEFGLLVRRDREESPSPLLQSVARAVSLPVIVGDFTIHTSISVGVACCPDDSTNRSDLMRHADIAMYIAKRETSTRVFFFDAAVNARVEKAHRIDLALRKANVAEEFTLQYQPLFAAGTRELLGMEALVRWNPAELGRIGPDEFIPVAEENGTIAALSEWILGRALSQIREWNGYRGTNLVMGINVSPTQLDDAEFVENLERAIAAAGVRPEWVNLEMTERSAMKGEERIAHIFCRLAKAGIASSIDDFGTGYSSLSYLKKFDIDYLKIAKQLIDGIETDETDRQIVRAIIMMASALGMRTIAEGVETAAQLGILESLGCDEIQGYYLGRPVPPEEFERLFLKG